MLTYQQVGKKRKLTAAVYFLEIILLQLFFCHSVYRQTTNASSARKFQ